MTDLLRGKIMYETVDRIKKALNAIDTICFEKGYKII